MKEADLDVEKAADEAAFNVVKDTIQRHDEIPAEHLVEIPAEHLATRTPKVCPACFHHWLAPKDEPNAGCPMCRDKQTKADEASRLAQPKAGLAQLVDPVIQSWVMTLTWKMQSILFSSLRGPDQELLRNIKQVSKWMRSVTQNNADPSKPYMNDIVLPQVEALYKELEHCPCHFVHHFLDGLAIIAYHHPDEQTAFYAAQVHYKCAEELFHFYPETPEWFEVRHRDKRNGVDPLETKWNVFERDQKVNFYRMALRRFD